MMESIARLTSEQKLFVYKLILEKSNLSVCVIDQHGKVIACFLNNTKKEWDNYFKDNYFKNIILESYGKELGGELANSYQLAKNSRDISFPIETKSNTGTEEIFLKWQFIPFEKTDLTLCLIEDITKETVLGKEKDDAIRESLSAIADSSNAFDTLEMCLRETEASKDKFETLYKIISKSHESSQRENISLVLESLVEELNFYSATLLTFEDNHPLLRASYGNTDDVIMHLAETRMDLDIRKIKKISLLNNNVSCILIPLMVQTTFIGVLILSADKNVLSKYDDHFLGLISMHIAISASRAEYIYKVETLAMTDGLTGVFNHRYFRKALQTEIQRGNRYHHQPFGLLLIDIDHFKKINDTYGHQTGDVILRETARILKEACRGTDILCRYGGEEFVIVAPQTSKEGSYILAERIRKAVEAHTFVSPFTNDLIKITISIGVAVFPEDTPRQPYDELLIKCSDDALYESKKTRNTTILCSNIPLS